MQLPGIAIADGGQRRVNSVQVLGVNRRFWNLALEPVAAETLAPNHAYLNQHLAARLGLRRGDELLVRVQKPGLLPREAPLASNEALSVALRLKIAAIVTEQQMGRFSLRTSQIAPANVFISLDFLAGQTGLAGRANLLLIGQNRAASLTIAQLRQQLAKCWTLADVGLKLRHLPTNNAVELTSDRIFLAAPVVKAASAVPAASHGVFTYLVNELKAGVRHTPYSFVAAPGPPLVPPQMQDDEIIINRWLAQDLAIEVGARLRLSYYVPGPLRQLQQQHQSFQVRQIVPLNDDRTLMPDFPGLANIENCRNWDSSLPIDLSRIRSKDEAYWNNYRGTPKAFVTLNAAQRMWRNRFGQLTAMRYPGAAIADLATQISERLSPQALGLDFFPIRRQALESGSPGRRFWTIIFGTELFHHCRCDFANGPAFCFYHCQIVLLKPQ